MESKYWIGLCPPTETEEYVKIFKLLLKEKLGDRYGSVNSLAHLTFLVFGDENDSLSKMEKFLEGWCKGLSDFPIRLNNMAPLGAAYCFFPDETSKPKVVELMRSFFKANPLGKPDEKIVPHISIARRLSEEQMAVAKELFSKKLVDHTFLCNNIAIRKFNPKRGQYEIYKRFPFGNPPDLKLF